MLSEELRLSARGIRCMWCVRWVRRILKLNSRLRSMQAPASSSGRTTRGPRPSDMARQLIHHPERQPSLIRSAHKSAMNSRSTRHTALTV